MKIAYIVSQFPKLSETFILRELLELERRGHELTIVSLKPRAEPLEHADAARLASRTLYRRPGVAMLAALAWGLFRHPVHLASILARIVGSHARHPAIMMKSLALLPAALLFALELKRRGVAHVHAHWATYPALAAWIIGRINRVPYSVTGHAHDLFLPNPMLARKVRDAAFFATISEFNRAWLVHVCGPDIVKRVRIVRCGLPLSEFPFRSRQAGQGGSLPTIVSVGRLVDYKGFDLLLKACGRLTEEGRRLRCVIVGEGPERQPLERLASRLGIDGEIVFAGGQRQEAVREIVREADLFVLACRIGGDGQRDGIPIVLMEAMALGVPVISTRLSGIPELVVDDRTGLLVQPDDDAMLARAIGMMLDDPDLRERLRVGARAMIEEQFDLMRSVDRLSEEFESTEGGG